jgi:hypothetical protein
MAHPGGRPSKYRKEYCQQILDYFDSTAVLFPTFEGYANKVLDIGCRSLYDWASKHEEFSHSMEKCAEKQKERLIDGGLGNKYNSSFARFVGLNLGMKSENSFQQVVSSNETRVSGGLSINWVGKDSSN